MTGVRDGQKAIKEKKRHGVDAVIARYFLTHSPVRGERGSVFSRLNEQFVPFRFLFSASLVFPTGRLKF
jgi:hypothetical protein